MLNRWFLVFFAVLAVLAAASAQEVLQKFEGCTFVPTEWADGDSFQVRMPDEKLLTVRLYGADCVEWHVRDESDARRLRSQRRYFGIGGENTAESVAAARGFGEKAAKFVASMLAAPFTIHTAFADGRGDERFQRVYAFVTTSKGKDLASLLVGEGLARAFGVVRQAPGNISASEYRDCLADLELTAASQRRGIWKATDWTRIAGERQVERAEAEEIRTTISPAPSADGVNPNTASRDELMSLPGIGETLALRIIEGRSEGAYNAPGDLARVRGIRTTTIEAISPSLRFTDSPSAQESPAKR